MGKEAPDTRLSPSGQLRAEFDPFLDGLKVVSVFALLGALSLEDVGDEGRVTDCRIEMRSAQNGRRICIDYLPSWLPMYSIKCCCSASMPAASNSSGENLASA